MEKHLFNFANILKWPLNGLEDAFKVKTFIQDMKLDGIEMLVYDSLIDNSAYEEFVIGAHLKYWTGWMPLYENDEELLTRLYKTPENRKKYYGALNYEEWLENIRLNIKAALKLKPEYLVWHVADVSSEEAFSFKFRHSNVEVLDATANVLEEVIDEIPSNVKLLFENLWWPGLTLTNPQEVLYFLNKFANYNVGIMLDTGHLLNTSFSLTNEAEAINFLLNQINKLGECKKTIKGLHLNLSLSSQYRNECKINRRDISSVCEIYEHIHKIDQHRAFTDSSIRKVIEIIEPEYINHELNINCKEELEKLLKVQLNACGR